MSHVPRPRNQQQQLQSSESGGFRREDSLLSISSSVTPSKHDAGSLQQLRSAGSFRTPSPAYHGIDGGLGSGSFERTSTSSHPLDGAGSSVTPAGAAAPADGPIVYRPSRLREMIMQRKLSGSPSVPPVRVDFGGPLQCLVDVLSPAHFTEKRQRPSDSGVSASALLDQMRSAYQQERDGEEKKKHQEDEALVPRTLSPVASPKPQQKQPLQHFVKLTRAQQMQRRMRQHDDRDHLEGLRRAEEAELLSANRDALYEEKRAMINSRLYSEFNHNAAVFKKMFLDDDRKRRARETEQAVVERRRENILIGRVPPPATQPPIPKEVFTPKPARLLKTQFVMSDTGEVQEVVEEDPVLSTEEIEEIERAQFERTGASPMFGNRMDFLLSQRRKRQLSKQREEDNASPPQAESRAHEQDNSASATPSVTPSAGASPPHDVLSTPAPAQKLVPPILPGSADKQPEQEKLRLDFRGTSDDDDEGDAGAAAAAAASAAASTDDKKKHVTPSAERGTRGDGGDEEEEEGSSSDSGDEDEDGADDDDDFDLEADTSISSSELDRKIAKRRRSLRRRFGDESDGNDDGTKRLTKSSDRAFWRKQLPETYITHVEELLHDMHLSRPDIQRRQLARTMQQRGCEMNDARRIKAEADAAERAKLLSGGGGGGSNSRTPELGGTGFNSNNVDRNDPSYSATAAFIYARRSRKTIQEEALQSLEDIAAGAYIAEVTDKSHFFRRALASEKRSAYSYDDIAASAAEAIAHGLPVDARPPTKRGGHQASGSGISTMSGSNRPRFLMNAAELRKKRRGGAFAPTSEVGEIEMARRNSRVTEEDDAVASLKRMTREFGGLGRNRHGPSSRGKKSAGPARHLQDDDELGAALRITVGAAIKLGGKEIVFDEGMRG